MSDKYRVPLICVSLVLAIFTAFEGVRHCGFVFDDNQYVNRNPHIKCGLSCKSIAWAFTNIYASNWHPVTWLSHILDYELFGPNPFGHHMVNLLFHMINSLLLFLVLKGMSGAIWRSAFVAAVFAVHPLHVESVAWVAERKDVLCALFWILTIAAYMRYAERPSLGKYLLVILAYCLGLMSKPMIITLPFVLLLLDYWPLSRLQLTWQSVNKISPPTESTNICCQKTSLWRLICEKIPLFILTAIMVVVTLIAQHKGGAMERLDLAMDIRIANVINSYIGYIAKMVYPSGLAVLYPHQYDHLLTWQPIFSAIVLILITVSMIFLALQNRPYLAVGWLWYLGTLVPVSGLVQTGVHAMADRFSYLPSIGVFIIVAWGVSELLEKKRNLRIPVAISAVIIIVVLTVCTRVQVRHWRNSLTLFGRAFQVTKGNPMTLNNLGAALMTAGRIDEAAICYKETLRLEPNYVSAHTNLSTVLIMQGRIDEAILHYRQALQLNADLIDARNNLAFLLRLQGNHNEAVMQYRKALKLKPDHLSALSGIAWILAAHPDPNSRDPDQAIEFAEHAAELTDYNNAAVLDMLAAAYAAAGRFSMAIETSEKALDLAESTEQKQLAEDIRNRLLLFKTGQPYIENGESVKR